MPEDGLRKLPEFLLSAQGVLFQIFKKKGLAFLRHWDLPLTASTLSILSLETRSYSER
jgi:hypothetical protein